MWSRTSTPPALAARGVPEPLAAEVIRMVDRAEYKRRQGPVGIKITPRAFGKDRRMPITNRYAPLAASCSPRPWPRSPRRPARPPPSRPPRAGFGRTLPGQQRLVVTFADHPTAAQAMRRLHGLGRVQPLRPRDRDLERRARGGRCARATWPSAGSRCRRPSGRSSAPPTT